MFMKCNKFAAAEKLFIKAITEQPNNFKGYFNLATLLSQQQDRITESLYYFDKVIDLKPDVIETYGSCSGVLIKLGDPLKAISYCEAGLLICSSNTLCLININVALRQVGRISEAILLSSRHLPKINISRYDCVDVIDDKPQYDMLHNNNNNIFHNVLNIVILKWGTKYDAMYVNRLAYGIHQYMSIPHRIICYTDDISDINSAIVECRYAMFSLC